ncbi:hypothetical protein T492DRAFT_1003864 [Pavlovales sp. CCMP2436]|nr:hypothetical protein T492DRAFT_1003864 [Pavlovales sp. CCMP2436]
MFHDGVRVRDLPFHVRTILEGKLPPEISASPGDDDYIEEGAAVPLAVYPAPGIWVRPAGAVPEVGAAEVARGWALADATKGPVVFRGVGSHWPAVSEWRRVGAIAEQLPFAMVRVATGPAIAFCRETHLDVKTGVVQPPSRVVAMPFAQFCRRLRQGRGGLAPLLTPAGGLGEGEQECCYMQALAPDGLMADAHVEELLAPRTGDGPTPMGRIWMCAAGVWSPAHYDAVDSLLWQAVGAKRMVLWPPRATKLLRPYPAGHALERRVQLELTGARPEEALAVEVEAQALRADLRPGDAIFFPAGWTHHTEALHEGVGEGCDEPSSSWTDGISISLGLRI